jgi:hypothetical protein
VFLDRVDELLAGARRHRQPLPQAHLHAAGADRAAQQIAAECQLVVEGLAD